MEYNARIKMDRELNRLKQEILKQILEKGHQYGIDPSSIDEIHFNRRIEAILKPILRDNRDLLLNRREQERIFGEIVSELLGLGPIDQLLKDPAITEIMVNGPKQVYIEREGKIEATDITFRDEQHLLYYIEKIVSPVGRSVTEFEPFIDVRLKDGSRVNVVRSPITAKGPLITIRKFSGRVLNMEDLINYKALTPFAADFLKACVLCRLNTLISAGSNCGKTTLLNVLASFIPEGERLITIEDTRELHIDRAHTVFLETRPPNMESKGEISIRDLVRNSLHMRPDRIIIGEVRSSEVLDMIQAMNTGHEGSMTTFHANSPLDALDRLEVLTLMGSHNISSEVAKRQIITAIDLVIQLARFADGTRRITEIAEVIKCKEYKTHELFVYDEDSHALKLTGNIPTFYPMLKRKANYSAPEFEK